MRKIVKVGLVALVLAAVVVAPQVYAQFETEIALTRQVIQTKRQAIVADTLKLPDDEARVFWPLYREYREAMAKVEDRTYKLMRDFVANYETLTDKQAEDMLNEYLTIQTDELELKKKHVKKFSKDLPAKTAVRFFQLENKMDGIVRVQLAAQIPLVMPATQ
jgi:hypothetical protein